LFSGGGGEGERVLLLQHWDCTRERRDGRKGNLQKEDSSPSSCVGKKERKEKHIIFDAGFTRKKRERGSNQLSSFPGEEGTLSLYSYSRREREKRGEKEA